MFVFKKKKKKETAKLDMAMKGTIYIWQRI